MSGPLTGVRVLELCDDVAGAYAGLIVADEGANVIKVEPAAGDPLRHVESHAEGDSRLFQALNRGKQSVVVDLTNGRDSVLDRLLSSVDVFLVSVGAREREALKLRYEELNATHPRLIYVGITPFGEDATHAPDTKSPLVLQAFSGLMAAEGKSAADGTPAPIVSVDMPARAAGLFGALGIAGALLHRERTGRGQEVTLSQLASALFLQGGRAADIPPADAARDAGRARRVEMKANGLNFAEQMAARRAAAAAMSGSVFYRAFNTADGAVFLGALSRPLRDRARRAMRTNFLHRDDPAWDPQDAEFMARATEEAATIVAGFRELTTAQWLERCDAENVPAGDVVFPEDLAASAQAIANEYIVAVDGDESQRQAAATARFSRHEMTYRAAPRLGEHTDEVVSSLEQES